MKKILDSRLCGNDTGWEFSQKLPRLHSAKVVRSLEGLEGLIGKASFLENLRQKVSAEFL